MLENDHLRTLTVSQLSWYDLYMSDSPNEGVEILNRKLTKILDIMAPIRTIQVRAKYAAWLSTSTKRLLQERDVAQKVAIQTRDQDSCWL